MATTLLPASRVWQPRPREFDWVGFRGLESAARRQAAKAELRDGPPEVEVAEDHVFLPASETGLRRRQRDDLLDAGEEDAAGPDPRSLPLLDEEVVYLGWRFNHYGHFLMQSLARVWFLSEVPAATRVLFHQPDAERFQPTGWSERMLALFGVPPERVATLREPTRVRRLLVPEPFFSPRSVAGDRTVRAHVRMGEPYRAVAERLTGGAAPTAGPLYLSRSRLPSGQRRLVGEEALEERLRRAGVAIAHPEQLSLEEQVRLVNRHTDLVSNAGSAAQNVLFALHGPRLHLLANGTSFSPDYFLHQTVCDAPTTFVNALGTCGRPGYPHAQKQTPLAVVPGVLEAHLAGRGLLADPDAIAGPLPGDPCSGPEYAEAWLHGRLREAGRREPLPPEVTAEAEDVAAWSWPVALALARAVLRDDRERAEAHAGRFAELAAAETDAARLARYRTEVLETAPLLLRRCGPGTAARLRAVLADRFGA